MENAPTIPIATSSHPMTWRRSRVTMRAPMTALPRTAPSTKGNPWTAIAASDTNDRYCAVTSTSATTSAPETPASTQASLAPMSERQSRSHATRDGRQPDADARAEAERRRHGQRPAHRLDPVAHVDQPVPLGRVELAEPCPVILHRDREAVRLAYQNEPHGGSA